MPQYMDTTDGLAESNGDVTDGLHRRLGKCSTVCNMIKFLITQFLCDLLKAKNMVSLYFPLVYTLLLAFNEKK